VKPCTSGSCEGSHQFYCAVHVPGRPQDGMPGGGTREGMKWEIPKISKYHQQNSCVQGIRRPTGDGIAVQKENTRFRPEILV
jgi:hypothetical protein